MLGQCLPAVVTPCAACDRSSREQHSHDTPPNSRQQENLPFPELAPGSLQSQQAGRSSSEENEEEGGEVETGMPYASTCLYCLWATLPGEPRSPDKSHVNLGEMAGVPVDDYPEHEESANSEIERQYKKCSPRERVMALLLIVLWLAGIQALFIFLLRSLQHTPTNSYQSGNVINRVTVAPPAPVMSLLNRPHAMSPPALPPPTIPSPPFPPPSPCEWIKTAIDIRAQELSIWCGHLSDAPAICGRAYFWRFDGLIERCIFHPESQICHADDKLVDCHDARPSLSMPLTSATSPSG